MLGSQNMTAMVNEKESRMKIKEYFEDTKNKYKGLMKWVCKNGHNKYLPPGEDFDICNICGTKIAKKKGIVR